MIKSDGRGSGFVAVVLVVVDAVIVYFSFLAALKIRHSVWYLLPSEVGLGSAAIISVCIYMLALVLSGLYQSSPREMHLDSFLRTSVFMLAAAAASLTITYLAVPLAMPPRSVASAQFAFSVVGVLGIRAGLRYLSEQLNRSVSPTPRAPAEVILDRVVARAPISFDAKTIRDYLTGRTVLVTGAGGSVGSVICEHLMTLNPFRLVMVDVSEFSLFQLENAVRPKPFEGDMVFRIADVRDETIMRSLFSAYRPDVVFHAAAYKHVPLMERHPAEAFANNTLTTVSLIKICEEFDTEQFIFISTDKAVQPSSVLGATKRLAEWYIRSIDSRIRFKTVRFGNVLGSQGSVIPTFVEQIDRGGPVTVTHPEMERYFMTADEAASLILATLVLDGAPVYAAQMGDPVRIRELADHLIEEIAGSTDAIAVEFSGLRPGEKLTERLWSDDEITVATENESIVGIVSNAPHSRTELDAFFAYLGELTRTNRPEELRKALFKERIEYDTHRTRSAD